MWLQFEVVRGPVGAVRGGFGASLGPKGPQTGDPVNGAGDLPNKTNSQTFANNYVREPRPASRLVRGFAAHLF